MPCAAHRQPLPYSEVQGPTCTEDPTGLMEAAFRKRCRCQRRLRSCLRRSTAATVYGGAAPDSRGHHRKRSHLEV